METKERQMRKTGKKKRISRKRRRRRLVYRRIAILVGIIFLLLLLFFLRHPFWAETGTLLGEGKADIVLDAGHGGHDQGASSEKVLEKDLNLEIALKTRELLKEAGYDVAMTRKKDNFLELGERAEYANKRNAKIFVSIHCNSSEAEARGIETFYAEAKEESQGLAEMIQAEVIGSTGAKDRGVKSARYTVIVRTDMPAVLVETGFLNHPEEKQLLQNEAYQEKLAEGIASGIIKYLETTRQE